MSCLSSGGPLCGPTSLSRRRPSCRGGPQVSLAQGSATVPVAPLPPAGADRGGTMGTVVVGYVPKPEGHAAVRAAVAEAQLRDADLVVVSSHRGNDEGAAVERELASVQEV